MPTSQPQNLPLAQGQSALDGEEIGTLLGHGGTSLYFRAFHAEKTEALLLYLHGIEGHSQWFAKTAQKLQAKGISTYALDRRGAGLNSEERGDLDSWQTLISDLNLATNQISTNFAGVPVFLVANCWSAMVALAFAASSTKLSGLVLTAPALKTKVDLRLGQKWQVFWSWLFGQKTLFDIPLETHMFTDNPVWLTYIEADPLRLHKATAAFFVETLKARLLAAKAAKQLNCPLLVLLPERDAIVDVKATGLWFEELALQDKSLRLYNSAHSLDFDLNADRYVEDLAFWIKEHS